MDDTIPYVASWDCYFHTLRTKASTIILQRKEYRDQNRHPHYSFVTYCYQYSFRMPLLLPLPQPGLVMLNDRVIIYCSNRPVSTYLAGSHARQASGRGSCCKIHTGGERAVMRLSPVGMVVQCVSGGATKHLYSRTYE